MVDGARYVVGTSGFSYRDWRGPFYPEKMKPDDYLGYYQDRFGAVEINATYYGIPKPGVFEGMVAKTRPGFEFTVKANKATTHEHDDRAVFQEFADAIEPLRDADRLSGVLAQFPWGFRNDATNRSYLAELAERYRDLPLFVEFRHNSWDREEVYDFIRRLGVLFVSVDEPQIGDMMPPVTQATGGMAYVRFHGRNETTWWGKTGDRYDYEYSESELGEWIDRVEDLEKSVWKIYAFFNNCHHGYAARNAEQFKNLLRKQGKLI